MVAVDDAGQPTTVMSLRPITPDERRYHAAAELRKTMRRKMEQRSEEMR